MQRVILKWAFIFVLIFFSVTTFAKNSEYKDAEALVNAGNYAAAADLLAPIVNGGGKVDSKTVLLYGKCLENMTEQINTDAEMECYRRAGAPKTPSCMEKYAEKMNARYGAGSFQYNHNIVTIKYTGIQFQAAATPNGKKGDTAAAAYEALTRQLIGQPDVVLARVQAFINENPSGKWHDKGVLLLGRVNEDIWWIHKKWAWLLYNWDLSEDELIVKSEPYRYTAMEAFKKVKGGSEGNIAKKELKMLQGYKSDGKMYSIINESNIKGVKFEPQKRQLEE